jgi:hypothetical protein
MLLGSLSECYLKERKTERERQRERRVRERERYKGVRGEGMRE